MRKVMAMMLMLCAVGARAQRAVVMLDSSRDNRCARSGEGDLWVVKDMSPRNMARPEVYTLTVRIRVLPVRTIQQYEVAKFLPQGGSAELGCSQGDNGASYQIVSEK